MRAYTRPMMVSGLGGPEQVCQALEDLPLRRGAAGALYDEAWLQRLIQEHPSLLPVADIEPALLPLAPICMELPVPSGFVDNLFITPTGGLVVVECKLWRNPEARREVVGQALDYAKDLSRFSFEDLQRAVRIARKEPGASLFELATREADPAEEARFIDAVSRNLRLGRMLLIIAGDGIQESAEQLADFLQRHVGLSFTLALVELRLWRGGEDQVLVHPRVLARTVQIERAVVRLEEGVSMAPARIEPAAPAASRPTTLSADAYYEQLAAVDPTLPTRLKAFIDELQPLGVVGDIKRNLALKWKSPEGAEFNLGVIDLKGQLGTDYCNWSADVMGRIDLAHAYQQALADLLPGAEVRRTAKPTGWRVVVGPGGQNPRVASLLDVKEGWTWVISDYVQALSEAEQRAA